VIRADAVAITAVFNVTKPENHELASSLLGSSVWLSYSPTIFVKDHIPNAFFFPRPAG
jgi:hypothetical protein